MAAGGIATASMLVGPALAGLALAAPDRRPSSSGAALVELLSAVLVRGIHPIEADQSRRSPRAAWRSGIPDAVDGLRALRRQPRAVLSVLGAAAVMWGALDVFIVVLALDVLALGESGVGFLERRA